MPALHTPFIQSRLTAFQALFTEATVSRPLNFAKDSIAAHQRILRLPFIRFAYKAATGKAADLARTFNAKLLEAKTCSAKGLLTLRQQLLKSTGIRNAEALAAKAAVIVSTMSPTAAAEHELLPPLADELQKAAAASSPDTTAKPAPAASAAKQQAPTSVPTPAAKVASANHPAELGTISQTTPPPNHPSNPSATPSREPEPNAHSQNQVTPPTPTV